MGLAGLPLLIAGYFRGVLVVIVAGLGIVPAARFLERREAMRRERVYTHGREARGHVLAVEPGSDAHGDRLVRLEFWTDGVKHETSVTGCRLARQGLSPGEDVLVVFDPDEPKRCLVIDRARGGIVDAI